jgi:hypothetical protein
MQAEAARQHRQIQALAQGVTARRRVGASKIRILAVQASFADFAVTHDGSQVEALMAGLDAYCREVSGGKVQLTWTLASPVRLPKPMAAYAHGEGGRGDAEPNARTMVRDALVVPRGTHRRGLDQSQRHAIR